MKNSKTVLLAGFLSIIFVSYLLSACSHELKLVGDKDKPVSLNVEIKFHIYQHAADDVDEMMKGLDDETEAPEKTSFVFRKFIYALADFGVSTAYAEETANKKTLVEKTVVLYRKAYPYLKKQMLGENRDGYISVINKAKNAPDIELKETAKIADELNAARKNLYQFIANLEKGTIRNTQTAYADTFRQKSKKGIWVETKKEGKWQWKQKK